jgi:hydroxymethylpyrimidine/phosphomethylpyrimidine kinase
MSRQSAKSTPVNTQPLRYPSVLSIAGSDSGGGAGIQADIKTISALGCYASTAITALTAQNTLGVQAVEPVSSRFLELQIKSVLDDMAVDSVKVGMFASLENLALITELLKHYPVEHVVFDPVMMSSSGASLVSSHGAQAELSIQSQAALTEGVIALMRESSLFTPNLVEASYLLGRDVVNTADMQEVAASFIDLGANAVLIKGGHLEEGFSDETTGAGRQERRTTTEASSKVTDVFMDRSLAPLLLESPRLESPNLHGTGCTLSSAVASYLATGLELRDAVQAGRVFLLKAIEAGAKQRFNGAGPLNHGFAPIATQLM